MLKKYRARPPALLLILAVALLCAALLFVPLPGLPNISATTGLPLEPLQLAALAIILGLAAAGGIAIGLALGRARVRRAEATGEQEHQAVGRYQHFIQSANHGIIRYECEPPFSISAPLAEQKAAMEQAVLRECNAGACRLLNFPSIDALIGMRLGDLPDINRQQRAATLDAYFSNDYWLNDHIVQIASADEPHKIVHASLSARSVIEQGQHVRVWVTLKDYTEKIQAQQALKASEQKFAKTFHASADVIMIVALDDEQVIAVNEAMYEVFGYRPDEVIGRSTAELNTAVDLDARTRLYARVRQGGSVSNLRLQGRKKSGEIMNMLITSKPITLDGRPCIMSVIHDATHIFKAEQQLRRYEQIVSAITDVVMVADDTFNYCYVNSAYLDYIGKPDADVIGKNMREALGEQPFAALKPTFDQVLGGAVVAFEFWNNPRTGEATCLDTTLSRFKHKDDERWFLLAVGRDITARKRMEDALRQNEQRYQSILKVADAIPWEVDAELWQTTYIGPQVSEQFGYEPAEWKAKNLWMEGIHPDDRKRVAAFYHAARLKETSSDIQYRLHDREHKVRWVRDIFHSFTDESGRRRLQGTMVDLTAIKHQQDQLAQAQKMQVVGRLTGGVAHDFNNLLTVIRGNLGLLAERLAGSDADTEEMLADALSASDDGAELTEQLLSLSSKQELKPQAVAVNAQIENAARLFRRMLPEDMYFNVAPARGEPMAWIDPARFDNAVLNLMINARDAIQSQAESAEREGALSITADCETITAGQAQALGMTAGEYVTVTVTDNGCGMAPETIQRAYEPFFTTKGAGKGAGLGLSMVYGFVNQSGGSIAISSEPGVGASITLYLPALAAGADDAARAGGGQTLPNGKETVLVTEDEARVRKFAVKCLQSLGYRVLEAEDAEAAIAILETNPDIDVLFSDNVLPGKMNGRQLGDWAMRHCPNIKVIMTTGFSEHASGDMSVYDGAFPLLRKPYSREDLAAQIHELTRPQGQGPRDSLH